MIAAGETRMDTLPDPDPDPPPSFDAACSEFMVLSSRSTQLLAQAVRLLAHEDGAGAKLALDELRESNRRLAGSGSTLPGEKGDDLTSGNSGDFRRK
jgi:hypothetical protein